jgi:predicted amidophosphoribosyltransferase
MPGHPSPSASAVRALVGDLVGLVLPVECAGCGAADVPWCGPCAALLDGPPWRCEDRAGRFDRLIGESVPVWTLAECAGAFRQAVVAWKDRGRADLTPLFAAALSRAAADVAATVDAPEACVVAVPSAGASRRRRGGNLVDALAGGVADGLRRGGLDAHARDVLRRRPGADQVGLGARARARNLAGRVRVRGHAAGLAGVRVVLVDDVLTTGASLAACRDALERAGAGVVAAFTLASTPRPESQRFGDEHVGPAWTRT